MTAPHAAPAAHATAPHAPHAPLAPAPPFPVRPERLAEVCAQGPGVYVLPALWPEWVARLIVAEDATGARHVIGCALSAVAITEPSDADAFAAWLERKTALLHERTRPPQPRPDTPRRLVLVRDRL